MDDGSLIGPVDSNRLQTGNFPQPRTTLFDEKPALMNNTPALAANAAAERIVVHFQAQGFHGISEAFIIRIRLKAGDRATVEAAFGEAGRKGEAPPVHQYFEIRPLGHFAETRSYEEARAAIQSDFTLKLRLGLPRVFFDPAPILIDDVLAGSTRYDLLIKLRDNVDGYAFAILLNDPDAAFLDYLGTHLGNDWEEIMGNFETTVAALGEELI